MAAAPEVLPIAIIGAGPGGLCTAIRLLEAGLRDFRIFERASGVGGTWYNNIYPGLECDVRSHLYSFSFAPKKDWSQPYPAQPEILAYLQEIAKRYEILPHVSFDTEVRSARWDVESSTWELVTSRETLRARVLVSAMGMFNVLRWPELPGLDSLQGTLFHSARWRSDCDMSGERVAVIGSAASAVQLAPEIAPVVEQLLLFQRSASWVLPKANTPFTPSEIERFVRDPDAARLERAKIEAEIDAGLTFSDPEMRRGAEGAGLQSLAAVRDPDVRARLTPTVPWGCHRPLVTNKFYPMFNRPNVELITEPIERITERGIATRDGREHAVDTIVCATGFDVGRFLSAIEVTGRGGLRLDDVWRDGAMAYRGIAVPGFPNAFMLYGPNTNNGSILTMIEAQADYIVRQIRRMRDEGLCWVDVRPEPMKRWVERVDRELAEVEVWQVHCHNYYRGPSGRIVTQWPKPMAEFARRLAEPDLEAYEVSA